MIVIWIMFLTALSFLFGSTGLGFYFYYFSETSKKIDYMPIIIIWLMSAWIFVALGCALGAAIDEDKEIS